jgi:hypothetical protein
MVHENPLFNPYTSKSSQQTRNPNDYDRDITNSSPLEIKLDAQSLLELLMKMQQQQQQQQQSEHGKSSLLSPFQDLQSEKMTTNQPEKSKPKALTNYPSINEILEDPSYHYESETADENDYKIIFEFSYHPDQKSQKCFPPELRRRMKLWRLRQVIGLNSSTANSPRLPVDSTPNRDGTFRRRSDND